MTPDPEHILYKQIYLKDVDIFQDLTPEEIDALAKRAPIRQVEAGTIFYRPDEPTEVLFILKMGRVQLYHLSPEGKSLTTAILEAGTIFGEMELLGQGLYQSYAEALTPCVLCLMGRKDVITLLLGDPRIALRITEILSRRLGEAQRRLSEFVFKNLSERVAALLLRHTQEPRVWSFSEQHAVRYTHEQLAEVIGTNRETVTKILNEFRARGWVELQRGKIVLLDHQALQAWSNK